MNQTLFTEEQIQTRVRSLALQISFHNNLEGRPVVVIGVLNGAFMFFTDLVRNMVIDCEIDFIQAKSYTDQTQDRVAILKDILIDIKDKDIYIVDDIYDSGNTMKCLINHLKEKGPKSIMPVTLFKRHTAHMDELIYGFELNQEYWIRGYGLDGKGGLKRNQPYITGEILED
jgi:hypoxanthine phosphoribosyltransferase